jgi:biopolymer transport protein ExbB/TolQ
VSLSGTWAPTIAELRRDLPVVSVVHAFGAVESLAVEQRANALAQGIALAMNNAMLGAMFAIPSVVIGLLLSKRARTLGESGRNP